MDLARITAALSALWRSIFARPSRPAGDARHALGDRGERLAARFLRRRGFSILYRNYRPERGGEIDLVCRDRRAKTLVFVEVKTRSSEEHGSPAEAVDQKKQRRIARGAAEWLSALDDPDIPCRFDVVEVIGGGPSPEIRHLREAFRVEDPWRV